MATEASMAERPAEEGAKRQTRAWWGAIALACAGATAVLLGIGAAAWAAMSWRRSESRLTLAVLEAERARRVAAVMSEAMAEAARAEGSESVVSSLRAVVARLDARHLRDPHLEASLRLALGRALAGAGALVEGEREIRWGYGERRRMYGESHPATALGAVEWARVLAARGEASEAEKLSRPALSVIQRARGPQHEDTVHAMHVLAESLLARPEAREEAEALLREALETARYLLGPESPTAREIARDLEGMRGR
jgi:hypothetical protein